MYLFFLVLYYKREKKKLKLKIHLFINEIERKRNDVLLKIIITNHT